MKDEYLNTFLDDSVSYNDVNNRIHEIYGLLIKKIKLILNERNNMVLIADGWSDKRGRRYIGLAVRFIEADLIKHIFLILVDIPEIHHEADKIEQYIRKALDFYNINIEQIVSICTDSASVMSSVALLLDLEWDLCFIHMFNYCIKKFMESDEFLGPILKKVNLSRKKEVFVSFLEVNDAPLAKVSI